MGYMIEKITHWPVKMSTINHYMKAKSNITI